MAACLALWLAGCAGGSVDTIVRNDEKELPSDLRDKFEIKDTSISPVAQVSPSPSPTPTPTKKHHKKKRAQKIIVADEHVAPAEPSPSPSAPFVYPHRRPAKDPMWIGEKATYEITYFGLSAGNFVLETLPLQEINNRKVYHVRGTAISSQVFSMFYRLNDMVETFIDYDGEFSHRFHILLDETKQKRDSLELFDSEKQQTYFWNKWNRKDTGFKETKVYAPIPAFSQDTLSSMFYLRTVPLQIGDKFSFPVVSEGNHWDAEITVVRREIMATPMGRVETIVLKPETKFQGVLKKSEGDSFIWITDDDRRVVVRLEAKVKIGTIVAQLKQWSPGTPPAP
jgi:hypothetical protein